MRLYAHQAAALAETEGQNHVAFFHEMGLGKTFTGAEKMHQLGANTNLLICQKSKVEDWLWHFTQYYDHLVCDLTVPAQLAEYMGTTQRRVGIINYELAFRRPELKRLKGFTIMLDESSLIQNENAKRSKFILGLHPTNVILLSGTPTGGKYERLWSQLHLLGWPIPKDLFYKQYVRYHYDDSQGFPLMVIDGYKNEERLKRKMRECGCHFLKTEDVFDLPGQVHQTIHVPVVPEYWDFIRDSIAYIDGKEVVGETTLTKCLYARQLCGQYNKAKLDTFKDILGSTSGRLIVFYNFNEELAKLEQVSKECGKPVSMVNGQHKDLSNYNKHSDSVTLIQYQAGAMGLNLQKANKIIYFTPTQASELFEQSKKRTHRIGQTHTCFYYYLTCKRSIEESIYKRLAMRKDYTDALFEEEFS